MKTRITGFGGAILGIGLLVTSFMGSSVSAQAPVQSVVIPCPVVKSFMRFGIENNIGDVTRLQLFLKHHQSLDVDVSGDFDVKTETAVKEFQKKYMSEVLGPWGATKASGIVYITTAKKINQLACGVPLALNTTELGIINNYKAPSTLETLTDFIADNIDVEDLTAALVDQAKEGPSQDDITADSLGGGTMAQRFWGYFVGLFR